MDPMIKFIMTYNSSKNLLIFCSVVYNYLHHFYFVDSSVDTATDLAETDYRTPDSDTTREVVEIVRYEKLVIGLAD